MSVFASAGTFQQGANRRHADLAVLQGRPSTAWPLINPVAVVEATRRMRGSRRASAKPRARSRRKLIPRRARMLLSRVAQGAGNRPNHLRFPILIQPGPTDAIGPQQAGPPQNSHGAGGLGQGSLNLADDCRVKSDRRLALEAVRWLRRRRGAWPAGDPAACIRVQPATASIWGERRAADGTELSPRRVSKPNP